MSKRSLFAWLGVLALLDFAALDDITTGNEPNFTTEWVMLLISVPIAFSIIQRLRTGTQPATPVLADPRERAIAELQQSFVDDVIDSEEYERKLDDLLRKGRETSS